MADVSDHIIRENTTGSKVRELRCTTTVSVVAGAVTVIVTVVGEMSRAAGMGAFWSISSSNGSKQTRSGGGGPVRKYKKKPAITITASTSTFRRLRGMKNVQESGD